MPLMNLSEMELIHYGTAPLTSVRHPEASDSSGRLKPCGLWVSVKGEDDWKSWCESEGFRAESLVAETRITLAVNHNVLHLGGPFEIDAFTKEYEGEPQYAGDRSIDWDRVASRYDGIVIAPYCWQRRMTPHTFWYYGWDCASGCIWNPAAIASLESLEQVSGLRAPQGENL